MRMLLVLGLLGSLPLALTACGGDPSAPPSAAMTPAQRTAVLDAVFMLARARIAVEHAAPEQAYKAYDKALASLPRGAGIPRVNAFAQAVDRELADYLARAKSPAAPVAAAEALVQYDVRDLIAAMESLGFKPLERVGLESVSHASLETQLADYFWAVLPVRDGHSLQLHTLQEERAALKAHNGILELRDSAERHAYLNVFLSTLRASWPALWPGILPTALPETSPK